MNIGLELLSIPMHLGFFNMPFVSLKPNSESRKPLPFNKRSRLLPGSDLSLRY